MLITAEDYLPFAREFEGEILHLYLDTVGKVTVGIGHMLPTADAIAPLGFFKDGQAASTADKRAAWQTVAAAQSMVGQVAGAYASLTDIRMTPESSAADFQTKFADIFGQAVERFKDVGGGFDAWPKPAQLATCDMAFNLGVTGLYTKFPTFRGGLDAHDWALCARECERGGIGAARNAWTRRQFESLVTA